LAAHEATDSPDIGYKHLDNSQADTSSLWVDFYFEVTGFLSYLDACLVFCSEVTGFLSYFDAYLLFCFWTYIFLLCLRL
jgi:hypothetical protein